MSEVDDVAVEADEARRGCLLQANDAPADRAPTGDVRLARRSADQRVPSVAGEAAWMRGEECRLEAAGTRSGSSSGRCPTSWSIAEDPRELEQRQRVARRRARSSASAGPAPMCCSRSPTAPRSPRRRAAPRITSDNAAAVNGRSPGPCGEDHRHRLGLQPARGEDQRLRRHRVEPVRVLDQAQQRLVLRRGRQQTERADVDREALGARADVDRQSRPERRRLRCRQVVEVAEHRPQQRCRPAHGSSASDSTPTARSTRKPSACCAAHSSRAVLPMPASPRRTSAPACPSRAASSRAPRRSSSAVRPTSMPQPTPQRHP